MPLTRTERKARLLLTGTSQQDVAAACGVDETLVSHVMAGRRYEHPDAPKVKAFIARLFGIPVAEAFPDPADPVDPADATAGSRAAS